MNKLINRALTLIIVSFITALVFSIYSTAQTTLPSPTNLRATASEDEMVISWNRVPGANVYEVSYKKNSETAWGSAVSVYDTSYTFTGLDETTEYNFRVKAKKLAGTRFTEYKKVDGTLREHTSMGIEYSDYFSVKDSDGDRVLNTQIPLFEVEEEFKLTCMRGDETVLQEGLTIKSLPKGFGER